MSANVIPFTRPLSLGDNGRDVTAVKRALQRLDLISNHTRIYGPGAVKAVRAFELMNDLKYDGVYDLEDHRKLSPHFDAYGAWLMGYRKAVALPEPRERLTACAMALYNYRVMTENAGNRCVHYTMTSRRMSIVRNKLLPVNYHGGLVIEEDCSSGVTGYYWQAKLPDPNGFNFNGLGYTGTLWVHGVRVETMYPGDLPFYGWDQARGCPKHVAIAVGDDPKKPTTRVVTHGHEGGPFLTDLHYRSDLLGIRSYL